MTELDYNTAMGLLFRAVEEKGEDFVYTPLGVNEHGDPQCKYFEDGTPGCIVGHILSYMGYDHAPEGVVASHALSNLQIDAELNARSLLDIVQTQQDLGRPWGDALELAIESLENL